MIEIMIRLVVFFTALVRRVSSRLPRFEQLMRIRWTDAEFKGVIDACALAGHPLGFIYHWHIINAALIHGMRRMSREAIIKMALNHEKLSGWDVVANTAPNQGLVIATPHYGHFVLSIITLGQHLEGKRDLYVFYEDPLSHGSNSVFDQLHHVIFGENSSKKIVHNNRKGIVAAIKGLQAGGILLIMPDVYSSIVDTYAFPFFGRYRHAMLGTGTLAYRARASIVPMVSVPSATGLGFTTTFAQPIPTNVEPEPSRADLVVPFEATTRLFESYQAIMSAGSPVYWQYTPSHFASREEPTLPLDSVIGLLEMLPLDVRAIFGNTQVLDLDSEQSQRV